MLVQVHKDTTNLLKYQEAYKLASEAAKTSDNRNAINRYMDALSAFSDLFDDEQKLAKQNGGRGFDPYSQTPATFFLTEKSGESVFAGDIRKELAVLSKKMLERVITEYVDGGDHSSKLSSRLFASVRASMKLQEIDGPDNSARLMQAYRQRGYDALSDSLSAARQESGAGQLGESQNWSAILHVSDGLFTTGGMKKGLFPEYAERLQKLLANQEPTLLPATDGKGPTKPVLLTQPEDRLLAQVASLATKRMGTVLGVDDKDIYAVQAFIFEKTAIQRSNQGLPASVKLYFEKAREAAQFAGMSSETEKSRLQRLEEDLIKKANPR